MTIVYDNLSATNAILLANSIRFYNNQMLNILEDNFRNHNTHKRIERQFYVPLAVLVVSEDIDNELMSVLHGQFDKVIETSHHDTFLLNDDSLGIQQHKVQLWKELAQYEKCIFLESYTMVSGWPRRIF